MNSDYPLWLSAIHPIQTRTRRPLAIPDHGLIACAGRSSYGEV